MILSKATPMHLEAATDYAKALFSQYPNFKPTRSLYLDLEGSGDGNEVILSLYWPQLRSDRRFAMLWRGRNEMNPESLITEMEKIECDPKNLDAVVVFSVGAEQSEEQKRFEAVFGQQMLPGASWVNMWSPLKSSNVARQFVRQSHWSKRIKDAKRIPNSLENLEYLFGFERSPAQRSHQFEYKDGKPGEMKVLELERQAHAVKSLLEFPNLIKYCEWDVQSMFRIARWCEGQV